MGGHHLATQTRLFTERTEFQNKPFSFLNYIFSLMKQIKKYINMCTSHTRLSLAYIQKVLGNTRFMYSVQCTISTHCIFNC